MSLVAAYEAVSASPHLRDVAHEFGSMGLDKVGAAPRLIWVPTEDSYTAPRAASLPITEGGQRVHIEAIWTRRAGVDVHVFERDYAAAEELIRRLHLALWEELTTAANYDLGRGKWADRGALAVQTVLYVQPLAIHVPIYDMRPAETVGGGRVLLPGGTP